MAFEKFLKIVGRNIARIRKQRSLNQKDLAEQSEISYRYFQSIESGSANVTLGTLYKLSKILNVRVCDLVEHANDIEVRQDEVG